MKKSKIKLRMTTYREPVSIKLHPFTLALLEGLQNINHKTKTHIIEKALWEVISNPLSNLLIAKLSAEYEDTGVKAEWMDINMTLFGPISKLEEQGLNLSEFFRKLGIDKDVASSKRKIAKLISKIKHDH